MKQTQDLGGGGERIPLDKRVSSLISIMLAIPQFQNAGWVSQNIVDPCIRQGYDNISIFKELVKHSIFIIACPLEHWNREQPNKFTSFHPITSEFTPYVYYICLGSINDYQATLLELGIFSHEANISILSNPNKTGHLSLNE
jgi:hypothetical protein